MSNKSKSAMYSRDGLVVLVTLFVILQSLHLFCPASGARPKPPIRSGTSKHQSASSSHQSSSSSHQSTGPSHQSTNPRSQSPSSRHQIPISRHPPQAKKGMDHHNLGDQNNYYYSSNIFDVLSFGATGDGVTDDTEAFQATWKQACQVESAVFEVPAYFTFLVRPLIFSGPCAYNIVFQIDGYIIALEDPQAWGTNRNLLQWIEFAKLHNIVLQGDGVIDGNGHNWWSLDCKSKGPNGRRIAALCDSPTGVRFYGSYNVTVQNLRIVNSPQTHLKFDNCFEVSVNNVSISSPASSPNTDGIHLQNTQYAEIQNSIIQTGDDCISIQTGTSNLEIHDVVCGPGHGISIGGLGQNNMPACVCNISVHHVLIRDSQNGVRIKTWQGGSGSVRGVSFSNINVMNISNPIIIDQFYCDAKSCENQTSAVEISGVTYKSIKGTYMQSNSVHLACSDTVPCTEISIAEVELLPQQGNFVDEPFCWNSYGNSQMPTIPPVRCLQSGIPTLTGTGKSSSASDTC